MVNIHTGLTNQDAVGSAADEHIFISGASGRLGMAIARHLAKPGVHLSLWGRNQDRLDEVANACRAAGAKVSTCSLDLIDIPNAISVLAHDDTHNPFDAAFFLAGQGDTLGKGRIVEDPLQVARLGTTNYVAPSALAAEMSARMAQRGHGRIGVVGSAASAHSLPFAAAYCSSKAGLTRFSDALRLAVKPHGVTVTMVSPGFFAPDPGDALSPHRPGEISVELVARRTIRAVERGSANLTTPFAFVALRWIDRLLPRVFRDRLLLSLTPP